jgi:hypothetical protein
VNAAWVVSSAPSRIIVSVTHSSRLSNTCVAAQEAYDRPLSLARWAPRSRTKWRRPNQVLIQNLSSASNQQTQHTTPNCLRTTDSPH